MSKWLEQKRFLAFCIAMGIGLLEGILTMMFPTFPITAVFGFEGIGLTAYLSVQTISDIKEAKFAKQNNVISQG